MAQKNQQAPTLLHTILDLKSRGIPDKQIVQSLRSKGHSSTDILEAMQQAQIKLAVETPAGVRGGSSDPYDETRAAHQSRTGLEAPSPSELSHTTFTTQDIQAIAETIVEERWSEAEKDLKELKDWQNTAKSALSDIQNKVQSMEETLAELKSDLTEKLASYNEGISDITTEIKAMDKVFRKILPTFTDNVKELSEIVSKLRK